MDLLLTPLQLQLLSVFMVCLQFFTDKEPDCTLQMIYKDFLIPPMFRSSLRNIPVSGCGCGHVTVYFYPCSGTFSLPQDGKCEGTKAWDDLTCHKMRNKMSVCQITLPDNWKRVKICINTDTRAQLLHHSWFAAPAECHLWSWNIPWASPLAMAFNKHLDSNMRRGFHGEGHCKIGLGFWWVMLKGEDFVPLKCDSSGLFVWVNALQLIRRGEKKNLKKIWP